MFLEIEDHEVDMTVGTFFIPLQKVVRTFNSHKFWGTPGHTIVYDAERGNEFMDYGVRYHDRISPNKLIELVDWNGHRIS